MNLEKALQEFAQQNNMKRKGPLCVALVVTRHAKKLGLPLIADELMTNAGGKVEAVSVICKSIPRFKQSFFTRRS
jgi:hypothetical protein